MPTTPYHEELSRKLLASTQAKGLPDDLVFLQNLHELFAGLVLS